MESHKTMTIYCYYIYFTTLFDCGHFVRQIKGGKYKHILYIFYTPKQTLS